MADNAYRSRLFSEILKQRKDCAQRRLIEAYKPTLDFHPTGRFMISASAWNHVQGLGIEPKTVFAHPDLLQAYPTTSFYYRGMALLSLKRVQQAAGSVNSWEGGKQTNSIKDHKALNVARLYNTMISSMIEGSSDWTLDNGYRNIVATMGIYLDGMFRNQIGKMAEDAVRGRIVAWMKEVELIDSHSPDLGSYQLPKNTLMTFGSEPDIDFTRDDSSVATIEIKGGRDPAGALERLGAMSKSFAETPPGCVNFLVAGVITPEMRSRLDAIGNVKVYLLDDISRDGELWDDFTNEVFHHAVRVF